MKTQRQIRGHLSAVLTIVVWGITFISIKVLLDPFSAVEIMFFRTVLAVLVLFIASPPRPGTFRLERAALLEELKYLGAGLCGVTLYFLFQNIALTYTLAANVSVLVSVAPLLTALASRFFLGEKLKANFFVGFTAAMAGIILIAFNGSVVLKLNPLGDVLSVLAALAWAGYVVLIKKINVEKTSMLRVTRKVFFYGLVTMLPVLPLFEFRWGLERLLVPENLLHLLFLGAGGSALCFFTWNYAVSILGPVKTSVYIYMIPVITIVTSALVLGETITVVAGVGMGLILAGMALSERERSGRGKGTVPEAQPE